MSFDFVAFTDLLSSIVDNRGKTCPVSSHGIPLIATNCISNSTLYPSYDTTRFVNDETHQTWFRAHPVPNDILFVCKGSPGRTNWVPDPVDFCIAQDMVAVRADPKKIYPKYLFAALRSSVVQTQIDNMHVGTMIPHFKKGDFDKLRIPVSSESAQVFIGDLYFSMSERIDLLRKTNATLEGIAQALFKSWFVDFDPVHAKTEGRGPEGLSAELAGLFPDCFEDGASIPKGWTVATLASLSILNPESWSAKNHPETVAYIDLANAKENEIAAVTEYPFDEAPSRARRVLRYGDTIVGTVRPGNRSFAFIGTATQNLTGSTGFAVLRPSAPQHAEFVYLAATADTSIEYLAHVADGGAYPAVRPEVVISLGCVVPTSPIMQAFHAAAAPIFAKVAANQKQVETLSSIRDMLLPRLISGQLRLPEAEALLQNAA